MTRLRLTSFAALAAVFSLATAPTSAQIIVDDFDNGIGPDEFVFQGGEAGTLSAVDLGSGDLAAQFVVDADEFGGFAGFGQPIEGGALDLTGIANPVLQFDLEATGTFTLEINFQNTGGGGEGEIRNALQFQLGPGMTQPSRTYRLPVSSFFTTNAASFEADDVFQYVWTITQAEGDGDPSTQETGIVINNVALIDGLGFESPVVAKDFDDADFSEPGFFYFGGGEFLSAAPTTDTPDGSANAFSASIDGDEFGGFTGFGSEVNGAPFNASGQETFNFFLRTNGGGVLEVNLQTVAGNGENEARERLVMSDTGGEYIPVSIPLEAMLQSGANPPDFSQVVNFVFTFVEIPGDGDPATLEFEFAIDALGFGNSTLAVSNELPPSLAEAPSVFPNPAASGATVAFDLAEATDVAVEVFDILGRRVASVFEGARAAGPASFDVPTAELGAGTYLVRVRTDRGIATTTLTVAR
ncbi:MAG: T9SS type A sorting domain-containing protein [Bacteroidota bacterium]